LPTPMTRACPSLDWPWPEAVTARSGAPSLRLGERWVHSAYAPEREAAQWAARQIEGCQPSETLFVVYGVGLGHHLRALADLGVKSLVAFEPDRRILDLWPGLGLRPAAGDVVLSHEMSALRQAFRSRYPFAKRTRVTSWPALEQAYPDQAADFRERLEAYVQEYKTGALTYLCSAADWLTLTLGNLPTMQRHPSVEALRGIARGWPVVIPSPGPSLDGSLAELAALRDRVVVVSPSQTLRALTAAGIQPDLVIVADSQRLDYHFEGVPRQAWRNLVVATKCHPAVTELPAERRFFYSLPPNPLSDAFYALRGETRAELPPGHSVSNVAFNLALAMEAAPIVLVGQDLCFSGEQMYCRGAIDGGQALEFSPDGGQVSFRRFASKLRLSSEEQRDEYQRRLEVPHQVVWVKGQDGQPRRTSVSLRAMLTWFERQAESLDDAGRLVNASLGGALIRGMRHLPLRALGPELPPAGTVHLEARLGALEPPDSALRRRVSAGLRRRARATRALGRLADRCAQVCERARKANGPQAGELEELRRLETRVRARVKSCAEVDALLQRPLFLRVLGGTPEQDDLQANLERSQKLYRSLAEAAEALSEALNRAIDRGDEP
jgi:hypothetical protein